MIYTNLQKTPTGALRKFQIWTKNNFVKKLNLLYLQNIWSKPLQREHCQNFKFEQKITLKKGNLNLLYKISEASPSSGSPAKISNKKYSTKYLKQAPPAGALPKFQIWTKNNFIKKIKNY